jgi:hypothetical protein
MQQIPHEERLGFRLKAPGAMRLTPSKRLWIKGEPQILRAKRSGFRLRAQTPAKRLNLPVTILRGITRSHPEHGS